MQIIFYSTKHKPRQFQKPQSKKNCPWLLHALPLHLSYQNLNPPHKPKSLKLSMSNLLHLWLIVRSFTIFKNTSNLLADISVQKYQKELYFHPTYILFFSSCLHFKHRLAYLIILVGVNKSGPGNFCVLDDEWFMNLNFVLRVINKLWVIVITFMPTTSWAFLCEYSVWTYMLIFFVCLSILLPTEISILLENIYLVVFIGWII